MTNDPLACPHECGWRTPPARGRWSRAHNRIMLDKHLARRSPEGCDRDRIPLSRPL